MSTDSNSNSNDGSEPNIGQYFPLPRPSFQLRSLPIQFRWEVSRRHPLYLRWWTSAQRHHRGVPYADHREPFLRPLALVMLGMIGVSGEPVSPETPFDQLDEDQLNEAWLSGAVHPITFRGLAGLLIADLPKETLATLGMLFLQAGCEDEAESPPNKFKSLIGLAEAKKPDLDSLSDEPIVSINPAGSRRQITKDLATLLKEWKAQRGLSELRDRSDKYPDYLQVWDLREGWTGGDYDITKEKTLRTVAEEMSSTISTVNKHYRNAFEMIIGHPYSPENWLRFFGPYKLLHQKSFGLVSRRRPLKSPTKRDIPESVLRSRSAEDDQLVSTICEDQSNPFEQAELVWDIKSLIDNGKSNEEILDKLELTPSSWATIEYVRNRNEGP